jgi:predicted MarR family transcription regulator
LSDFDERTQANMDVVLDEICGELPHGGDHESRKMIAEQLMQAARSGKTTLNELTYVGRRALARFRNKP